MRLSWPEIPRSGWPEGQWALHLFISAIRVAVQQLGCRIENYFLPITHYSSVDRAVKSICGEMAAMRCFHVPGVFGLKPDLRIAGVALVITYFFTALIG